MSTTYYCNKCEAGLMRFTETVLLIFPPAKYEHKCTNCGHVAYYDRIVNKKRKYKK